MKPPMSRLDCQAKFSEYVLRARNSYKPRVSAVTPVTGSLELPLRCRCGHLRGVASEVGPSGGFRFVCYCKDCQAFARFLDRPDVLDAAGGTDIFQMPTGRVSFVAGTDAVRCLCFSSKIFRWY